MDPAAAPQSTRPAHRVSCLTCRPSAAPSAIAVATRAYGTSSHRQISVSGVSAPSQPAGTGYATSIAAANARSRSACRRSARGGPSARPARSAMIPAAASRPSTSASEAPPIPQVSPAAYTPVTLVRWTSSTRTTAVPDASGTAVVRVDEVQRTSVTGVYAAGETCGIGGASLALVEGRLAAAGIIADLAGRALGPPRADRRQALRLRAFAAAMDVAYPVPAGWDGALPPLSLICRCEEVPYARVATAIADGAADGRQVKQLTRCAGRVDCGAAAGSIP